jgi:multiple sugar transport system ATP-binding protein
MGATIEIKEVTKTFGKVRALDRVNLTVQGGDFLVLLGPSGCGKTTLLRCVAGLERPDEGEIFIDGKPVFSAPRGIIVPAGRRNLGMVFQSYALWPHMTVRDNLGFGLRLQKVPRKEIGERIHSVLSSLDMEGLDRRYPSELSGGQQQRVALGRLLATKPPLFLMDEPLSNLDARLRLDMRSELKRVHHDLGVTTLYVTHDQTEAMAMANHVVVMDAGQIQQYDPPLTIYNRPANLFVAGFIGMPRINLIPGAVIQEHGQSWLKMEGFKLQLHWPAPEGNVITAIRPEDVRISLTLEPQALEYKIYAVLPSGPEVFIQARRGKQNLVIREMHQLDLSMDQSIWINFNEKTLNLYDEKSGRLLAPETETLGDGNQEPETQRQGMGAKPVD